MDLFNGGTNNKIRFRHVALTEIFRAFLPISSNSHWYITVYIIILLLAKYLNKIIENLSRKQYEQLLLVLLLIFSIVPTITFSNITNDSGKGVINMTIMYMIGQYLSKYSEPNKTKRNVALAVFAFSVQFALNMLLSYLKGGKGIAAHFSLDYSVFTVLLAVGIFNLFINKHYTSKAVNALSSHVMGIYLAEGVVRSFLQRFIDLGTLLNSALFPLGVVGFTLLVIAMSIVIDVVYRWFYKLFGEKIIGLMVKCTELISDKCKNVISKKQSQ